MLASIIPLALVFLAAISIRLYLLVKYRWVGVDTFYYFIVAQEIRKSGRLPQTINCFLFPEKYDYPPLLHLLLSLFDRGWHRRLQYLSPIVDIATGVILLAFSLVHFGPGIATLAVALYLFTPMTFDIAFSLSARSVANAFLVVAVLALITYNMDGGYLAIALSVAFSVLVLLSHRLTTQSWACVMVSFSVVQGSATPLLIIASSVIIAAILTRFHYLKVLRGHANFLRVFLGKLTDPSKRKELDPVIDPVALLFNMPMIVMLPLLALHFNDPALKLLITWGLSLTILSALWVFGQGVRHMGNAIPAFSIVISALLIQDYGYLVLALIIVSFAFTVYKIYRLERHPEMANFTTPDMLGAYDFIKNHKAPGDVLLCLPFNFTYSAAYFTGCTMLHSSGGFARGLDINQHLVRTAKEGKVRELIDRYNVRWVLISGNDVAGTGGQEMYRKGATVVIKVGN
jgi:hypothetical protein